VYIYIHRTKEKKIIEREGWRCILAILAGNVFEKFLQGTWEYLSVKTTSPKSVFHALSNDVFFIR